eukprot:5663296-Amphidinium_carterae.1
MELGLATFRGNAETALSFYLGGQAESNALAGLCSPTESTSGLPVLVCFTKSPRILADSGPK